MIKEKIKNYYFILEDKYYSLMNKKYGKIILSPVMLFFKILGIVLSIMGFLFGVIYLLNGDENIETEENVDYFKDNLTGNLIVNKKINNLRKKIDILDNEIHKNNYRNLNEDEMCAVNNFIKDPELKNKSFEDRKKILKILKKIDNVRTPNKSIDDLNDLYR